MEMQVLVLEALVQMETLQLVEQVLAQLMVMQVQVLQQLV